MTKMPSQYVSFKEWLLLGPMGPMLEDSFKNLPVLCVDGGIKFINSPQIWIGDGDSGQIPSDHPATFIYPRDKDHSDLALAFSLLSDSEVEILHLWGFFGGRIDHFLANLGESSLFLKHKMKRKIVYYDEFGIEKITCFSPGDHTLQINSLFSVMALEKGIFTIKGQCQYPVSTPQEVLPLSSLGLSNQGHGEIHINSTSPFFVIKESEL